MGTLWQDVKYGARMLAKNRGFTAVAVLTLALGIGANTAIFSIVHAVLFRPLPVKDPNRLMFVFNGSRSEPYGTFSYPDYVDYRERKDVFEGLIAFSGISVSVRSDERAEMISGSVVSGNYFDVLGIKAVRGRTFLPEEDHTPGTNPVVVIGHEFWQRRFAGDAGIVGQQIALNGHSFTIIGVAPAGFKGPEILENNDLYVPMMMQALVRPPRASYSGEMNPDLLTRRRSSWLNVIGRLKPGVSQEQAQANVANAAGQLAQTYPDTNRDRVATLFPVSKIDPRAYTQLVAVAALLMAVVGMVLLIACANVANLLLARTSARRKEIAVRISMGATRARLVRQLLVESVLLALGGGSAGVLLAWWTCDALKSTTPATGIFSFTLDYGLDVPVLVFTLALSVATGIVFGLAPALQASRPDILAALKGEAMVPLHNKRRFKMRDLLVVAQMALSLVLLVDAGLFLRSSNYAQNIDPGFDADKILIARLNINLLRYTKAQGAEFYRQAVERISALPGVEAVSLARVVPISGGLRTSNVFLEGQSETSGASGNAGSGADLQTSQVVGVNVVSVKYFQTMGIKILRGRDFTTEDREGTPGVTIVNESFARRYFAAQEVLGKRVSFRGIAGPWTEIIGIVRDSKYRMLSETPRPYVYQPLAQNHETGMALHARAEGNPKLLVSLVRGELQALDRNLPLTDLQPLTELLNSALFPARMGAALLTVFGALALLLASIGLYGVVSYAVLRRSREIGIRMALGAQRKDVLGMVLREGMTLVGIGTLIGWVTAAALSRLLAGFLLGISAMDPKTFAGIPLLLAAVAALANYLPARRAANVDPMVALRYE